MYDSKVWGASSSGGIMADFICALLWQRWPQVSKNEEGEIRENKGKLYIDITKKSLTMFPYLSFEIVVEIIG